MACAPPTPAPMAGARGGTPAGQRPPQVATSGPRSASRWAALTPRRQLETLLRTPGGERATERLQALWRGHRVRQRVLRGGKPCCRALIADCLIGKLQTHQLLGVRWLYAAATRAGGILADDPGLGKTLQAIAAIDALIASGRARRVLVVAPANLVANWRLEFRKWLGKRTKPLSIIVAGAGEAGLHDELKFAQLAAPVDEGSGHLLLLTSYESLSGHGKPLRASRGVDLAVLDEGHRLRGMGKLAEGVIQVPARARLLLTATPLPNNMDELYSLVTITRPGRLGTRADFREDFAAPIAAGRAPGASVADVADAEEASAMLQEIVGDVMLRRTNEELARGLPPKTTMLLMCRPTALQRALHATLQNEALEKALVRLELLRAVHLTPVKLEVGNLAGRRLLRRAVAKLPERPMERMLLSGKMQVCAALLDSILESTTDRIVIVSSSRSVLAEVAAYVRGRRGDDATCEVLTGAVGKKARERIKERFNDRKNQSSLRVLALIDKLAEGLTLIGANHLILVDPSWNPAVDEQSLGRVHRPGQLKACYLYRLLSTGSLDETILERQAAKSSLLQSLSSGKLPSMQSDDRALLFDLDAPDVPSRLHARAEEDSPYADESQWQVVDLSVGGLEPQPLRHVCEQALGEAVIRPGGGGEADEAGEVDDPDEAVGDPIAVGNDVDMEAAEQRLVSFVYRSV